VQHPDSFASNALKRSDPFNGSQALRYVHAPDGEVIVVTTSDERAPNIALLARELGTCVLTTKRRTLDADGVPNVHHALMGRRRPVDEIAT
jgi:hypothetical protein